MKPTKPFNTDEFSIRTYNSAVDLYNIEYSSYIDCINEYSENVYNDMKRIKEKINEAIAEANSPY